MQLMSHRTTTTASQALEHDHHVLDDNLAIFVEAAAEGRIERDALDGALSGLRRHIMVEEEVLFPPLVEAGVAGQVQVMLREHGELWRVMDELEQVVAADRPDPRVALAIGEALNQVLSKHDYKEDAVLYATVERVLDAGIAEEVRAALDSELPKGWTCAMA